MTSIGNRRLIFMVYDESESVISRKNRSVMIYNNDAETEM